MLRNFLHSCGIYSSCTTLHCYWPSWRSQYMYGTECKPKSKQKSTYFGLCPETILVFSFWKMIAKASGSCICSLCFFSFALPPTRPLYKVVCSKCTYVKPTLINLPLPHSRGWYRILKGRVNIRRSMCVHRACNSQLQYLITAYKLSLIAMGHLLQYQLWRWLMA